MGSILNNDVNGVINSLETNHSKGSELSSYIQSMLQNDETETISGMINRLHTGNDQNEDAISHFTALTDGEYKNAQNLGYFMGSIHSALNSISEERQQQADIISKIFSGVVAMFGRDIIGAMADSILSSYTSMTANAPNLTSVLTDLGFPRYPDGRSYENASVETIYRSRITSVMEGLD
jgi:hypothetical protein